MPVSIYNVSRNTVVSAYSQLCSEGYVQSKPGSGFIALKLDNTIIPKLKSEASRNIKEHKNKLPEISPYNTCKYNFQYGKLSAPDFPLRIWRKVSNKCLAALTTENMTSYSASKGEPDLRIELMKYLSKSRGVSCNPEQIIVSSGFEYCISLLCQLFRQDFH
jgi:GntR family transcriptional regulator / MocR family aminotransferase